jgi:hypothetical protein
MYEIMQDNLKDDMQEGYDEVYFKPGDPFEPGTSLGSIWSARHSLVKV